jgi:hypothetical protein
MQDGTRHSGEYPYGRMEWNFDTLVENLQACLPGYPGGKPAFDKLVELARSLDALGSVRPIIEATTPA